MKPSVIVLSGPTAVGKTALSTALAKRLGAEIISADSMQVYRGMDIGTAKVTDAEKAGIPHYMIDVADPSEAFSVADYVRTARPVLLDIANRGKAVMIVGGTGFYIQALLKDLEFDLSDNPNPLRAELAERAEKEGVDKLHEQLKSLDPSAAERIHPNNKKRLIRALEFCLTSGHPISELNREQSDKESPYRILYLVLDLPRDQLYSRIDKRVEFMLKNGLIEEVRRLRQEGVPAGSTAMQGIGYKEILMYLDGALSLQEAEEKMRLGSRHYAKRQLTWFRREKDAVWIDKSLFENEEALLDELTRRCTVFLSKAESHDSAK